MIKFNEIQKGDVFSEISHYVVESVKTSDVVFKHLESNNSVTLSKEYVENLLKTANQYQQEITVGKEDKKDGTLGIRSIWENIHSSQVFTVCFEKQAKSKTKTQIKAEKDKVINDLTIAVEKAKSSKKSMTDVVTKFVEDLVNNPITDLETPEDRVLTGYKLQFISRDGRYDCMDMDINELRPVNINTIKYLVFDGIKYIVK
jgi:flagellar hook-basal body complex protein FliE